MTLHPALIFIGGLVVILLGAEMVLRGGARFAVMLGVRPIMIGLTVVSIGTSAPELAIGIAAATEDKGPMAVANIAGTNTFNILFILGLSAIAKPLPLQLRSTKLDVPVMIVAAIVLFGMAWDQVLTRTEGFVLTSGAVIWLIALAIVSRRESAAMRAEYAEEFGAKALNVKLGVARGAWNVLVLIVGIGLTILGARLLVAGASDLARMFGVSEVIIGLTIVAIGTSAPELATTAVATYKDDRDVAIGNLIGSSISNILVILGVTCIAAPNGIDVSRDVLWIDVPFSAAVAIACYPVFRSDHMVSRREGIAFVLVYVGYMVSVLLLRT